MHCHIEYLWHSDKVGLCVVLFDVKRKSSVEKDQWMKSKAKPYNCLNFDVGMRMVITKKKLMHVLSSHVVDCLLR